MQTSSWPALKETIVNTENGLVSRVDAATADLADKENTSNRVQTIDSSSTGTQYPSAKAVYDAIAGEGNLVKPVVDNSVKIIQDQVDSQVAAIADLNEQVVGLASDVENKLDTETASDTYATKTALDSKLNKNLGTGSSGNILTVGSDGAITSSATIAQDKVDGLTAELDGKVNSSDLGALAKKSTITNDDIDKDASIERTKLSEDVQSSLSKADKAVVNDAAIGTDAVLGVDKEGNTVWYGIEM